VCSCGVGRSGRPGSTLKTTINKYDDDDGYAKFISRLAVFGEV